MAENELIKVKILKYAISFLLILTVVFPYYNFVTKNKNKNFQAQAAISSEYRDYTMILKSGSSLLSQVPPSPTPCGDTFPACNGECPESEICESDEEGCFCTPSPSPCGDTFPACNGVCPEGEICVEDEDDEECFCTEPTPSPCGDTFPACDGECPEGEICVEDFEECFCASPSPSPSPSPPPPPPTDQMAQPGDGCVLTPCGPNCCLAGCCQFNPSTCADFPDCVPPPPPPTPGGNLGPDIFGSPGDLGIDQTSSSSSGGLVVCDDDGNPTCTGNHTFVCPPGLKPKCLFGVGICVPDDDLLIRFGRINLTPPINLEFTDRNQSMFIVGSCQEGVPYCSNGEVVCTLDYNVGCENPTCTEVPGFPLCDLGGTFSLVNCVKPEPTLEPEEFNPDIDVTSTPMLPSIIPIPPELGDNVGIAYPGSNPSFEIKPDTPLIDTEIVSLDLVGSGGTFPAVQFGLLGIPGNPEKNILTLVLPNDISIGPATFNFNLSDGTSLFGPLEVVNFNSDIVDSPPTIRRFSADTEGNMVTVRMRGDDLLTRTLLSRKNSRFQIDGSNTEITLYPSGLEDESQRVITRRNNGTIVIRFTLFDEVSVPTNAVFVLATPRGIASRTFVIEP